MYEIVQVVCSATSLQRGSSNLRPVQTFSLPQNPSVYFPEICIFARVGVTPGSVRMENSTKYSLFPPCRESCSKYGDTRPAVVISDDGAMADNLEAIHD